MTKQNPVIRIKAHTNKHDRFLIVVAALIAGITLFISQLFWQEHKLPLMFSYLTALVFAITGLAKLSEPAFSILLSPEYLSYQHRNGQWQVNWQQIQRFDLVKETIGLEQIELAYVGIKLVDIDMLAKQISPRLANKLIHEQKPLISFAVRYQLIPFERGIICFEPYQLTSGELIKGPIAAFLHHSKNLHDAFGFHLYLPASSLDRDLAEFNQLLRQCKQHSQSYNSN